jgi:hypothetical protein
MAQSILEKSFIPIEYFYGGEVMSEDSNTPDYYPAICRAQALEVTEVFTPIYHPSFDFPALDPVKGTYDSGANQFEHPFLRIVFRPVTYHFSHTIEIVRPVQLLGAGQYSTFGTVFKFPLNTGGIIIHSLRGGLITTMLLRDDARNLILTSDGKAQVGTTTKIPSYLSDSLVNRSMLGNMFEKPKSDGGFGWTEKNFRNTHGANTIIEGINLKGGHGATFDIFPDMQIIAADPEGALGLFNPYENLSRTSTMDGSQPLRFDMKWYAEQNLQGYSSVSHAAKAAHGITAFVRVAIRDCWIENFAGHGIYVFGNDYDGVATTSEIRNTLVGNCCGNGLHLFGQNTSNLSISGFQAVAVEGWGFVNSVTNSNNTILTSVFHTCVKGSFLCPTQAYTNSFKAQDVSFIPTRKSSEFTELCNLLPIKAINIIGCHAEGGNYINFPHKQPSDLFEIEIVSPATYEQLYKVVPFGGSPDIKRALLDRIYSGEILNNMSLVIGDSVGSLSTPGVKLEGAPMVIWPTDGNIRPS